MQKIINVLAVLSFAGVAGIVGGGTYVYLQKDALIESAKEKVAAAAAEAIAGALPGMMGGALPKTTGGAIPLQGTQAPTGGMGLPLGGGIPGM
jgi:hypothetical protein